MNRLIAFPLLALLFLPLAAMSQTDTDVITAEPDNGTATNGNDVVIADPDNGTVANGFDSMSPGNKMITRALLDAQVVSEEGQFWTLDDIAAARSETGWGQVFKQMQADGLVEARNLGMVVSGYVRGTHGHMPDWVAVEMGGHVPGEQASGDMAVDTGNNSSHAGNNVVGNGETVALDANGHPETNGDMNADNGAASFDQLSPGNRMIARSLMDAQMVSENGEIWTLDDIATAKSEAGWGEVFQEMQAQGLVDARNLGHVVSQHQLNQMGVGVVPGNQATGMAVPGPVADGEASVGQIPGRGVAAGKAAVDVGTGMDITTGIGQRGANVDVTTAAGGNAQGNSFGAGNSVSASASKGVVIGTGATVGAAGNHAAVSTTVNAGSNSAAGGATGSNAGVHASSSAASASAAVSATAAAGAGQGFAHGRGR